MDKSYKSWGSLYLRISLVFLCLLVIIGLVHILIVFNSAKEYYQEVNQKLNATIAEHIASEITPFINGKVNHTELEQIFHNAMVLNPAIEIYLLDRQGRILSYSAPDKTIKLKQVNLQPINNFLQTNGEKFVCGDDPRKSGISKVFSAAEVKENGKCVGYVYIVLAGEDYDSIKALLKGSLFMRIGTLSILFTVMSSLIIGLFFIWILTRNLNNIIVTVKKFAQGDLKARIRIRSTSDLIILANTFNDMADAIVDDIDKLKNMEKLKSEFITNISHDLRTPLAVIRGYIETLIIREDKISSVERNKYMQTVIKNTEKLEKLVSDLFEISKLDTLQIQPNKETFFITDLISDILIKYQLLAEQKSIKIVTKISENIKSVYADISMIDRVLQNLIDNAIKFTNEKGIVTIIVGTNENANVEVKIGDNGIGISKDDLPNIFNRFYTSGNSQHSGGSGLGLAIVKKIMDVHKSTVVVESEIGKGTIFTFWLDIYDMSSNSILEKMPEDIPEQFP
jgi:signal transduction histidine kinase